MVPMFIYGIYKWLKEWWTGVKEEEKPVEKKASGCPVSAVIPEGVTECPVSSKTTSKRKVAGESSDAGNLSTEGVSDGDAVEAKKGS